MPTYLYFCDKHGEFEEFHSMSAKLEFCPQCEAEGNKQEVKRLIAQGGSRGVVELTGQELKEKIKSEAGRISQEAYQNEYKYANLIGPDAKYHDMQSKLDRRRR